MRDDNPPTVSISWLEAEKLIPKREQVHTYMQLGAVLFGADRDRNQIIDHIREYGAQLSGSVAAEMKHGLVIQTPEGSVFIETNI